MAILGFVSCSEDELTDTRVTYYASIDLEGELTIEINKGDAFVEPGYSAVMKGKDCSNDVVVTTNLDVNQSGVYFIRYSVTNEDGFTSSEERKLVVSDPNIPIEGLYKLTPKSTRDYNGTLVEFGASYEVFVLGLGNDEYAFDDLLAGWYNVRAGYGSDYAMNGKVKVAADGTVTLIESLVPAWEDSATAFSGKYDESSKSFVYDITYVPGMNFSIKLSK